MKKESIQLSDHFTYRRLLCFTLPSIIMMIFTSIYGVVDGFFVSNFVGKTPFAAVNFIMPFLMILGAIGFMFGTGGSALVALLIGEGEPDRARRLFGAAPIVSYHYGAGSYEELRGLLGKSLRIILVCAVTMLLLAELLAKPLAFIFVGYDESLMSLTLRAFRIFSFSFLFAGFAIFGSSFFTALNNGLISALISFLRTLVFQVAAVMLLPMLLGIDGIWFSIVAAEVAAVLATALFLLKNRTRYHYG